MKTLQHAGATDVAAATYRAASTLMPQYPGWRFAYPGLICQHAVGVPGLSRDGFGQRFTLAIFEDRLCIRVTDGWKALDKFPEV